MPKEADRKRTKGMAEKTTLDERTRELVAVGASIAGNCLPCLRYHFGEALRLGCGVDSIREAVELAKAVKERPMQDVYRLAEDLLERETTKKP